MYLDVPNPRNTNIYAHFLRIKAVVFGILEVYIGMFYGWCISTLYQLLRQSGVVGSYGLAFEKLLNLPTSFLGCKGSGFRG